MISFSSLWFVLLLFSINANICFKKHETIEYRALGGRKFEMTICGDQYVSKAFGHTDIPEHLQKIVDNYKNKQKNNVK